MKTAFTLGLHSPAPVSFTVLALLLPFLVQAGQVVNPSVTAFAKPYNPSYHATNLFAPGRNDYATASQGACSAPLTTNVTDGTWVELDFGTMATFDRFCLSTRVNTVDLVGTNRLYVGNAPIHSEADTMFTDPPKTLTGLNQPS